MQSVSPLVNSTCQEKKRNDSFNICYDYYGHTPWHGRGATEVWRQEIIIHNEFEFVLPEDFIGQ